MRTVKFEHSDVAPSEWGGYTLASCEQYWLVLSVLPDQPGYIFEWTGDGWTDFLSDALLSDRAGAREMALGLTEPGRVVRAVNLADYLRFDRRMAGYPRHQAGGMRHAGSEAALKDVYQAMRRDRADIPPGGSRASAALHMEGGHVVYVPELPPAAPATAGRVTVRIPYPDDAPEGIVTDVVITSASPGTVLRQPVRPLAVVRPGDTLSIELGWECGS